MVCGGAVPSVGKDRNPPALHLAEAGIRELDVQGQLGHPDGHFQGGVEDVVAEGDPGVHGSAGFLSANKHIVTATGYLGVGGWGENWRRLRSPGDLFARFCFGDGVTVAGLLGRLCAARDVAVELRIPKPHTSNPEQALSGCGGVFCRSPIRSQQAQMGSNKFLTRSYLFE